MTVYNTPKRRFHVKRLVALMAVAILLSTFTLPAFANHMGGHPKPKVTQITLYPFPECTNAFQCNARFFAGDEITFTGILVDSSDRGVPKVNVNIYRFLPTELKLLASAVTERDGTFEVKWKAQFFDTKTAGETFKQQINEIFTVYAQFDGDSNYTASRTGKQIFTVTIKDMFTLVATDKKLYRQGDSALVFVGFVEAEVREDGFTLGDFIDPDSIRATYDNEPVQLIKKKTGSYVFTTPALTVGHHQLIINAEKAGHNNHVGFVTVQVSGFFGK